MRASWWRLYLARWVPSRGVGRPMFELVDSFSSVPPVRRDLGYGSEAVELFEEDQPNWAGRRSFVWSRLLASSQLGFIGVGVVCLALWRGKIPRCWCMAAPKAFRAPGCVLGQTTLLATTLPNHSLKIRGGKAAWILILTACGIVIKIPRPIRVELVHDEPVSAHTRI